MKALPYVLCSNPPQYQYVCPGCGQRTVASYGSYIPTDDETLEIFIENAKGDC
jgi:hypothetical protein